MIDNDKLEEVKEIVEETRDKIEEKYIDPLKDEIDVRSRPILDWIGKHGRDVALWFAIAAGAVVLIALLIQSLF